MSRVLPDFRDIHAALWDAMHEVFPQHAHVVHIYRNGDVTKKTYIAMLWLLTPKGEVVRVWTHLTEREATFSRKQMHGIAFNRAMGAKKATDTHLHNKGCHIHECVALTRDQSKAVEDGKAKKRTS